MSDAVIIAVLLAVIFVGGATFGALLSYLLMSETERVTQESQ